MATRVKRKKDQLSDEPAIPLGFLGYVQQNVLALGDHMKENPFLYLGGLAFVVAVSLVAGLYQASEIDNAKGEATALVRALAEEEPAARAAALESLASEGTVLGAAALYLHGEEAIKARDFDTARTSFERLRMEHPNYEFTPDAVEGLGYMEEEEHRYEAALNFYQEVMDKWAGSFAARRQPFNLGHCQERLERFEDAISSYQMQIQTFPGSAVYTRAQRALARLRKAHGEFFAQAVEVNPPAVEGSGEDVDESIAIEIDEGALPTSGQGAVDETPQEDAVPDDSSEGTSSE